MCSNFLASIEHQFPDIENIMPLMKTGNEKVQLKSEGNCPLTIDALRQCFSQESTIDQAGVEERVTAFASELKHKRENCRKLLVSRLDMLDSIVKKKSQFQVHVNQREKDCLRRLAKYRNSSATAMTSDPILSRASANFKKIMQGVESCDPGIISEVSLSPTPDSTLSKKTELDLDEMLLEHVERLRALGDRRRPPEFSTEGVKLNVVVKAVQAEQKNKKSAVVNKRNASTKKQTSVPASKRANKQPTASNRQKKPGPRANDELINFPPALSQYVRGFFNVLRILLLEVSGRADEEGLTTDELCELISLWQSTSRSQRTNSPWINRCDDWSEVVYPALILLSAQGKSNLIRIIHHHNSSGGQIAAELGCLPKRGFVGFDEGMDCWYWLAGEGRQQSEVEADAETTLLARLFTLWARAARGLGGLNDTLVAEERQNESGDNGVENEKDPTNQSQKGRKKSARTVKCVPSPYFPTEWECQLSSAEQRRAFQVQEEERFSQPWAPFVYNQHGYASVVGPVRTAAAGGVKGALGRAREHPLLRSDRPPWVSISEIVRDAVARLPNGEGTRPEIAMLVQDSAFLVPSFNPRQLSQCISSALDRLQGEGVHSPVMYDSPRRLWIYRYRHLSPFDFRKLYKEEMVVQEEIFNRMYNSRQSNQYHQSSQRTNHQSDLSDSHTARSRANQPQQQEYIPDIDELTSQSGFYGDEFEDEGGLYYDTEDDIVYPAERLSNAAEDDPTERAFSKTRHLTLHYKH